MRKIVIIILLAIVMLFVCVFVYEVVDMLIDHQCYQLKPNENYNKTICERYWK